ncbi:MAG: HAD family hydrolase [Cyclobacteriaceae bacterium]
MNKPETIIFDLGAVLIDWNPRYLYRKIFRDESKMEWFLNNICTPDWNEEQDAGRSFKEASDLLVKQHPDWESEIMAFRLRWEEMLGGPIEGTVEILNSVKNTGKYKLIALTNWSAETFPIAKARYDFIGWFDGIVMSGEEKTRKPFGKFYRIMIDRYNLRPEKCVFIDDNPRNVKGGLELGIPGIQFIDPQQLKASLKTYGIIV